MMTPNPQSISVDRIFLDLHNPRHKPYSSEAEVIEYLCRYESVYALAKDMSEIGLNPLELFALISLDTKGKITKSTPFMVAEGNRRMCAIKLLNDPDLAPTKLRKDLKSSLRRRRFRFLRFQQYCSMMALKSTHGLSASMVGRRAASEGSPGMRNRRHAI